MTPEEKKEELDEICKLSSRMARGDAARAFIKWLGLMCIYDPEFHAKGRDIYLRFLHKDGEKGKIRDTPLGQLPPDHDAVEFEEERQVDERILARDARKFIKARLDVSREEGIEVRMPVSNEGIKNGGAYTIVFESIVQKKLYKPGYAVNFGAATQFWARMIQPIDPKLGYLIFSNEQPELKDYATSGGVYSGVGEVPASLLVGRVTAPLRSELRPILSKDSLRPGFNTWLVFLGSPMSNTALMDIRRVPPWNKLQSWYFRRLEGEPERMAPELINEKEALPYRHKPRGVIEPEIDYALISYLRGDESKQVLICCAGATTIGTWAAAEFLCTDEGVAELQRVLQIQPEGLIPSFEVVLEVAINKNAPSVSTIIYPRTDQPLRALQHGSL